MHTVDPHSPFWAHGDPCAQWGEHAGGAQTPLTQFRVVQSPFAPQAAPSAQVGLQAGGRQVPKAQTCELQSALTPQPALCPQCGEHVGVPHTLATHAPVAQSPSTLQLIEKSAAVQTPRLQFCVLQSPKGPAMPQAEPFAHVGAHAGGAHFPFVQSCDWQSALTLHAVPSRLPRLPVHLENQLSEPGGFGMNDMSWLTYR